MTSLEAPVFRSFTGHRRSQPRVIWTLVVNVSGRARTFYESSPRPTQCGNTWGGWLHICEMADEGRDGIDGCKRRARRVKRLRPGRSHRRTHLAPRPARWVALCWVGPAADGAEHGVSRI
jgi:hypothetical protein